tara:strand:+ start:1090 stop:1290 length:201 start_codon:yes stop_codon:yes gene_type:complete
MGNLSKKTGQGKTPQQYRDSSAFAWYGVVGMIILLSLISLCGCSHKTYVITEYDGDREIRWYSTGK